MGIRVNIDTSSNVTRTWRTLGSTRGASTRVGTTLLQAASAIIPPELVVITTILRSVAAVLLVVPFVAVVVASRVVALVVPGIVWDAEPPKNISSRCLWMKSKLCTCMSCASNSSWGKIGPFCDNSAPVDIPSKVKPYPGVPGESPPFFTQQLFLEYQKSL
jgi:hypothetical protein